MARVLAEKINQPRNSISLSAPIAVSLLVVVDKSSQRQRSKLEIQSEITQSDRPPRTASFCQGTETRRLEPNRTQSGGHS